MGTLSGTIFKTKVKYFPKILEFDNFHFSFFAYLRSKYTDTIFLNKFNFITFLGSWNFKIVKIGEISRAKGRGSRFFATYFSDKQGDIEVDSLFDVTFNIAKISLQKR